MALTTNSNYFFIHFSSIGLLKKAFKSIYIIFRSGGDIKGNTKFVVRDTVIEGAGLYTRPHTANGIKGNGHTPGREQNRHFKSDRNEGWYGPIRFATEQDGPVTGKNLGHGKEPE